MKFVLGIKPNVFTGWGTLKDARSRIQGVLCVSSSFGVGYENSIRNATAVYGYNIEVFKRGKHRKNKHYVIYRYTFPMEMFKLLNVEIKQGSRTFKIMPKKQEIKFNELSTEDIITFICCKYSYCLYINTYI